MNEIITPSGAAPALEVRAQGSDRTLRAGRSYRVGRDPRSDIVVDDSRVSWEHAILRVEGRQWLLEDASSTNGTFVGAQRVQRVEITGACQARLGDPASGPVISCSIAAPADGHAAAVPPVPVLQPAPGGRAPSVTVRLSARVLRIGRADDNEVVVSDLSVSRYHAELRKAAPGGYEIVDRGSKNGTYLNGQRIFAAPATEGDVIGIGPATFRLVGDELQEFIDTGDISLDARGLTVRLPRGKVILDDVSFPLAERCLLGVIGPSGAGKSTLLGALTGMQPATEGSVLYDSRDLYANYAELRHRIGLVPQDNIMHTQLSARRALGYAAELRFPRDTTRAERDRRVGEVLGELSLTPHADTRVSALSGGQRKRVNVALELLTKPSLLFLDEPTSGLDPGLDLSVMEMMAGLAHDGRTVIVVTHSVAYLDVCDRLLVLVPGGKVAYFGPPADGLRHFGQPGWAHVFQAFEAEPDRDWAGEYRRSTYCAQYVTAACQAGPSAAAAVRPVPPPARPRNRLAQLSTLVRRYLSVIASDRTYVAVLAVLPVILGVTVRSIPDRLGLTGHHDNFYASEVLLILAVGACLIGVASAVWELVKERVIYTRERAAGLSAGAYLWSKVIVLGLICSLQAAILVFIGTLKSPLPPHGAFLTSWPLAELVLAIAVLAVASMTVGLLISAFVSSSDQAMPMLVLAVLTELVLTGEFFPLKGRVVEPLSWFLPSRWGFGAAAATSSLNQIQLPIPGVRPNPWWNHSPHIWLVNMAMQVVLTAGFIVLTWWRLTRPRAGRHRFPDKLILALLPLASGVLGRVRRIAHVSVSRAAASSPRPCAMRAGSARRYTGSSRRRHVKARGH